MSRKAKQETITQTQDVKPKIKPQKIAVLGTATYSLQDVPYKDEDWQIWTLCYNYDKIPRFTKLFELHNHEVLEEAGFDPKAIEGLRKFKENLIVNKKSSMFPEGTEFPVDLVVKYFPRRYFTSSISWVLALAIITVIETQKASGGEMGEIGLYGTDMCDTDEYAFQRGACEYLIGYAEAKGIKVTISKNSPLMRTPRMYAFEDVGISRELVLRRKELASLVNKYEEESLKNRDLFNFYKGRKAECDDISNRWR